MTGARAPHRSLQLVLGIIAMATIANLQYSWVLFAAPLDQRFHWGRPALQFVLGIFVLTETWLVPLAGWLADRYGPKPVMIAGAVLVASGWMTNADATSLVALYAAAVLAGAGAGAVYGVSVGNALKWFPDKRGLAVGLITAGYGAGSAVTAIPILHMIEAKGYQTAFLSFGLAQGLMVLAVGLLTTAPARPVMRAAAAAVAQTVRDFAPREMLRSRIFWLMYLMFAMVGVAGLMAIAELPVIARDFGITHSPVGFIGLMLPALSFALSIDRVFSGLTRPFFGWVSDHIGRENTMAIAFGLQGAGIWALYAFGHDPATFVILSGVVYFTWGEIYSLFPATCADTYGGRHASVNAGFLYTAKGTASLLVPLGAYLSAMTGGWHAVFALAGALNILAAALALLVLRPWRRAHAAANGTTRSRARIA